MVLNNLSSPRAVEALIVDDSAVARKVLSSILHREGLETDVAVSGDDALDYLSGSIPDVIFLDHAMPGMDGFDVLRIIKSNPRTAGIPVIMFTSRSGEAYLNQARALGAEDVLSKDTLAEIDLTGRLEQLGLFNQTAHHSIPDSAVIPEKPKPDLEQATENMVRSLVKAELASLRDDLPELVKKISSDQNTQTEPSQNHIPEDFFPDKIQSPDRSRFPWRFAWVPLALVGFLLIAWTLIKQPGRDSLLNFQNDDSVAAMHSVDSSTSLTTEAQFPSNRIKHNRLLPIISWAISQQMGYGQGELPLSGARLEQLRTLLSMLSEAQFRGTVQLIIHQGRFCVITNLAGRSALPAKGVLLENCEVRLPQQDVATSQLMSLPFAMFLENSPRANGERGIQVSSISQGDQQPLIEYPQLESGLSAEEWNRIAASNNRVEVRLLSDITD